MKYIDTHSHILEEHYGDDTKKVLEESLEGLELMINVSYDVESALENYAMSQNYDNLYCTLGIHPNSSNEDVTDEIKRIDDLLSKGNKKVLAVGEIGLDFYREGYNSMNQTKSFRAQIELAIKHNLPVVVHSRETNSLVLDLIEDYPEVKFLLHSWQGSIEETERALEMKNVYFSYNGVLTFKNAEEIREQFKIVPLGRFMFETDCPWLTPEPNRGKLNYPEYVKYVYWRAAEIRGVDQMLLEESVRKTIKEFWGV